VLAHTPTDVGTSDTLTIRTLGFGGPYTYEWLDLPPGCSAPGPSEPVLTCAPNVNGSYLVSVSAIGRLGSVAFSPSVEWDVLAAPTATLEIDQAAIDLGGTAHLNVTFVGGEAPFRCGWTENGVPFGPLSRCATAVSLTPEALGEYRIVLNATDALGVAVGASPVRLEVTTLPGVVLLLVSPSASIPQVRVLTSIGLTTETSGGVAPFRFVWYEGSAIITSGASGGNLTYTPTSAGTKSITVQLTDADGNTVTSEAVLIDVISGSSGTNQTPTPSSSPALPTSALFVIGIVVLVALAAVLVLLIRRRGRPKEPPK
ncbi:MAG TPA: hypothetical protein VLY85_01890, partial [Thermoplasmata archaeon]|nr:hypothetical protein [Thermoplasmata archaeon]